MLAEDMLLEVQGSIPADCRFYVFGGTASFSGYTPGASAAIAPTSSAGSPAAAHCADLPCRPAPHAASPETHDLTRLVP
jgi:hypothetical protein